MKITCLGEHYKDSIAWERDHFSSFATTICSRDFNTLDVETPEHEVQSVGLATISDY